MKRLLLSLLLCVPLILSAQSLDLNRLKGLKPRNIGPAGMSGRVTAIDVVRDQPHIIYVGSASGGLWKSESGGVSWTPLIDTLPVASIGAISIYQKNPSIVWIGTGEGNPRNSQNMGNGVYRSLDGGRSWQLMGLKNTYAIHRIIVHPDNPNVVWAGVQGSAWGDHTERGVFKTTDGGKTWNRILYTNERSGIADLVIDPSNPNKLLAAMWEFRRQPWFFKSGGPGSGLYVTHDGGDSWVKRTAADSLPAGELGRIGLAIARNKPNVIYAAVEAKKNALYRSDDGGFKWRKVTDRNFGDRPFYYHEFYVDPSNENRLYSIYSVVSRSEDGGKTFETIIPYSGVHPDHHAWYIHPDNPNYIIDGNDGGVAISHDAGKTWRFVENLALGQFYHIGVDNEVPYNVYGGLQDNGSWKGPSAVWRVGGVRNAYWEELFFGDGFDVQVDATDSRYVYAMSQGGNVGRVDTRTMDAKFIKPIHAGGAKLRFNWNAALAVDPFSPATIYYGSQHVHKSTDRGENWTVISPDLTTNDPEKQKADQSGGLTFDATNAENHCTLLAIAPSPRKSGVIWTGSDDGQVNVTQDGGGTWTNVSENLVRAGMPRHAWIAQVHASRYAEGEATVVANMYRIGNDWRPYVFRTRDYGATWQRIVTEAQVQGYALSYVQDAVEPRLQFIGTEFGLYVSIDGGANWNKWKHDYPTVPTYDMVMHPREHDLVIGTFGRGVWVIDDVRALREIASKGVSVLDKVVHAFATPDAYLAAIGQAPGIRFNADAMWTGDNKPFGAMLTFSVKEGKDDKPAEAAKPAETKPAAPAKDAKGKPDAAAAKPEEKPAPKLSDTLTVEIRQAGKTIRTLTTVPKSGLNRIIWNLTEKGVRFPGAPKPRPGAPEPSGVAVLPGTYTVRYSFKGAMDSSTVTVKADPRVADRPAEFAEGQAMEKQTQKLIEAATSLFDRISEAKATITNVLGAFPEKEKEEQLHKDLRKLSTRMQDSLKAYTELFQNREGVQGIIRNPDQVGARIFEARNYLGQYPEPVNSTQRLAVQRAEEHVQRVLARVNAFFAKDWPEYRTKVDEAKLSPFRPYTPIEIKN